MPLIHRDPDLSARCYLADFEAEQLGQDSSLRIVQRDVGRRLAKWYPRYQMRSIGELAALPAFGVVTYRGGTANDLRYPRGFTAYRISGDCYLFRADVRGVPFEVSLQAQWRRN